MSVANEAWLVWVTDAKKIAVELERARIIHELASDPLINTAITGRIEERLIAIIENGTDTPPARV